MRSQTGITLTEMIVVMAIVGILVGVGMPSYRYITTSNRISGEINGLVGDLQYARSEAIKRGQTVTVCSSSDGATCSGDTTWTAGWLVFSDANNNATVDTAAGETVLRVQPALTSGDTLQDLSNTVAAITFNREGFATGLTNAGVILTLRDSTSVVQYTRCLSVTMVGTLSTQQHSKTPSCQ